MRCPFCSYEELKVTDSRNVTESNAVRRRRECLKCLRRFTTFETVDLMIQVQKRDGRYEEFSQDKLIKGLDAACRHTKISHDQVRGLAYKIASDLMERQVREITTSELGEIVMTHLQTPSTETDSHRATWPKVCIHRLTLGNRWLAIRGRHAQGDHIIVTGTVGVEADGRFRPTL